MKDDAKKQEIKAAINQLLKATGSDKDLDQLLNEKLECGHTREEHAAAAFLAVTARNVGISPKLLIGAAKALLENEDTLTQIQAEIDTEAALKGTVASDGAPGSAPMVLSPMPKEIQ